MLERGERPHCSSSPIQKVGVANLRLPIGLYSSVGHAIVSSISQKPHNWLQPSDGIQCCKFGLLYSMDEFMLLLQDKLQGGTESGIRTIESFLGFSMKENQLHTRHWEMATISVNACRKMELRNGRFRSNNAKVLQICCQLT